MHSAADSLPHNKEAEQAVLNSFFKDGLDPFTILEIISAEDIYCEKHRLIFKALVKLYFNRLGIDTTSLCEILAADGNLDEVGGVDFINYLAELKFTGKSEQYACAVQEKSVQRRGMMVARKYADLFEQGADDYSKLFSSFEEDMLAIRNDIDRFAEARPMTPQELLKKTFKDLEELYDSPDNPDYIKTPYNRFNKMVSRLKPSELIVINGHPGSGRLPFILNMVHHTAVENKLPVGVFCFDKSAVEISKMLMSIDSGVPVDRLRVGSLEDDHWAKAYDTASDIAESPLYICDMDGPGMERFRRKCLVLKRNYDIKMLVLGPMVRLVTLSEFFEDRFSGILRFLKKLARELDIPVVAFNNAHLKHDDFPHCSFFAPGRDYLPEADILLGMYRESGAQSDESSRKDILHAVMEINRSGPTGELNFSLKEKNMRVREME